MSIVYGDEPFALDINVSAKSLLAIIRRNKAAMFFLVLPLVMNERCSIPLEKQIPRAVATF